MTITAKTKPKPSKIPVLPKHITRMSRTQAKADTGQRFFFGITPLRVRLDAVKLGLPKWEQEVVSQHMAAAAKEFLHLSHIHYKTYVWDTQHIYGKMPSFLFNREGQFVFTSQPGITPFNAIMGVWNTRELIIIECSIALQLIYYKAMIDCLGSARFNEYVSDTGIILEAKTTQKNPLIRYVHYINHDWQSVVENPDDQLQQLSIGDVVYMVNIPPYITRHPRGDSRGFNLVYVGNDANGEYLFSGLFTYKRQYRYDELIDLLVEDYNKAPIPGFRTDNVPPIDLNRLHIP